MRYRSKPKQSRPSRKVKEITLIAHEGKSTEPNYIEGIKKELRHSNIHLKGPHPDPKTLVLETQKFLAKHPEINKAYCVFDHDGRKSFQEALKLIEVHNKNYPVKIEPITSTPCFEIWPLLHYAFSTKCYQTASSGVNSSKALIKEIRKFHPGYNKNSPTIYQELKPKTIQAIKNAKKLSTYQGHDRSKNPHTDVHKLVQMLLQPSDTI
jgi:RloB-like protein